MKNDPFKEMDIEELLMEFAIGTLGKIEEEEKQEERIKKENEWDESHYFIG